MSCEPGASPIGPLPQQHGGPLDRQDDEQGHEGHLKCLRLDPPGHEGRPELGPEGRGDGRRAQERGIKAVGQWAAKAEKDGSVTAREFVAAAMRAV